MSGSDYSIGKWGKWPGSFTFKALLPLCFYCACRAQAFTWQLLQAVALFRNCILVNLNNIALVINHCQVMLSVHMALLCMLNVCTMWELCSIVGHYLDTIWGYFLALWEYYHFQKRKWICRRFFTGWRWSQRQSLMESSDAKSALSYSIGSLRGEGLISLCGWVN